MLSQFDTGSIAREGEVGREWDSTQTVQLDYARKHEDNRQGQMVWSLLARRKVTTSQAREDESK